MTTILAVQTADDVVLAWDSRITQGNERTTLVEPKVWVRNGIGFAVAGDWAASEQLWAVDLPEYDGSDARRWVVKTAVPLIREAFIAGRVDTQDEGGSFSARMFLIVDGTLFGLDGQLSASSSKEGVYAMGSGGDYALGAFYAGAQPKRAVEVAIKLDTYSGGPVNVATYNQLVIEEGVDPKALGIPTSDVAQFTQTVRELNQIPGQVYPTQIQPNVQAGIGGLTAY